MSKTANLVAHATHDENNNYREGNLGCQIGCELQLCRWYQRGWTHIYRPKNADIREKIALFMENAVSNGFIGYDGWNRNGLHNAIFNEGHQVDELNKSVSCDCSSLVYCAVRHATGVKFADPDADGDGTKYLCPTVTHYAHYIENQCAGMFDKLEGADYTDSGENLIRGDLLVANIEGGHIAVWI